MRGVARAQGVDHSLVKRWYHLYEHRGAAGLQARVGKRVFRADFKLKVLDQIKKQKLSLQQACLRFDLSGESLLINWQKRLKIQGAAGLQGRKEGQPSMKTQQKHPYKRKTKSPPEPLTREQELLQEHEYLRAELAYLKKLQALVQAEAPQASKKRK